MAGEKALLLMVKGQISEMPSEDQTKIRECRDKLRTLVSEAGDQGLLALALVSLEIQVEVAGG